MSSSCDNAGAAAHMINVAGGIGEQSHGLNGNAIALNASQGTTYVGGRSSRQYRKSSRGLRKLRSIKRRRSVKRRRSMRGGDCGCASTGAGEKSLFTGGKRIYNRRISRRR